MSYSRMKGSKILKRDGEEIALLCKSMKPEERLVAYFQHSQLVHLIYQAGVSYRSRLLPLRKRKAFGKQ